MYKEHAAGGAETPSAVSPWRWIPTLYIAEGLPYVAVNVLTVLIYFRLGVPKAELAFYTGWLYLPWVIKPFWSPFVDLVSTKRLWTIWMQFLIGVMMVGVALFLPTGGFFFSTLCFFWLMAFFSATHDIAADGYYMLALDDRRQAAYVGVRSTFYRIANVVGQGGLVILAGWIERHGLGIAVSWSAVFYLLGVLFLIIGIYHCWGMPCVSKDRSHAGGNGFGEVVAGFGKAFVSFFAKKDIWLALTFMLLYRVPEALCLKLVTPFLIDARANGGLGMTSVEVGLANGTVGVIALLAGGIVGGIAIARGGLRRWLWPMALALTLPCLVYCWLSMARPDNVILITSLIGVEQFGYGFGFTAFMMYLIYFSQGSMQTSHYAFCTAFMALGMMLPGMAAGWLHDLTAGLDLFGVAGPHGYINFFWSVMVTCLFTYLATAAACRTLKR